MRWSKKKGISSDQLSRCMAYAGWSPDTRNTSCQPRMSFCCNHYRAISPVQSPLKRAKRGFNHYARTEGCQSTYWFSLDIHHPTWCCSRSNLGERCLSPCVDNARPESIEWRLATYFLRASFDWFLWAERGNLATRIQQSTPWQYIIYRLEHRESNQQWVDSGTVSILLSAKIR